MIDAAAHDLHAGNPGDRNPTDTKSNPSTKASEH
jgi:hypothetical protein